MSEPVKCFFLEPTDTVRRFLRRWHSSSDTEDSCSVQGQSYHNRSIFLEDAEVELIYEEGDRGPTIPLAPEISKNHDLWPTHCECGYEFKDGDYWQVKQDMIYRRSDNRELVTLDSAPPGAMWDAHWMRRSMRGPDGLCLMVKCPGGQDWMVDGRASNCTMPDDNEHRCWPRRGTPPEVTVDKSFGPTCSAGAGSIGTRNWHGFLRNGHLVVA